MATITAAPDYVKGFGNDARIVTWLQLGGATSDVGSAFEMPTWSDRSVQVVGTFSGTTVTIQGSNDGTNWVTLTDPAAVAATFAVTGLKQLLQVTRYIRPSAAAGTGLLDVYLLIVRK